MQNLSNDVHPVAINEVLIAMGVPQHLKGFDCIAAAVPFIFEHIPIVEVYRRVGEEMDASIWQVERNIRTAAAASVDRLGQSGIIEIYGNSLPLSGKPSNAQIMVTAARYWHGMTPFRR